MFASFVDRSTGHSDNRGATSIPQPRRDGIRPEFQSPAGDPVASERCRFVVGGEQA
jgi:hypothetical protein